MKNKNRGFTLIELLVVISIIAMLSSVVLVALNGARDKGVIGAGETQSATLFHAIGDTLLLNLGFNDCDSLCSVSKDLSGNGNDATGSGSRIGITTGPNGSTAVNFGNGGSMTINNSASLNPTGAFSLAFWIKTTTTSGDPIAKMNVGNDGDIGWGVYMNGSGQAVMKVSDGSAKYESGPNSPVVNDNKWHFVAFSIDKTSGSSNCAIYFDGRKAGNPACSNLGSISNAYPLNLSANSGGAGGDWVTSSSLVGSLDDVRLFGSAITAYQAAEIYAEGIPSHRFADAAH